MKIIRKANEKNKRERDGKIKEYVQTFSGVGLRLQSEYNDSFDLAKQEYIYIRTLPFSPERRAFSIPLSFTHSNFIYSLPVTHIVRRRRVSNRLSPQ